MSTGDHQGEKPALLLQLAWDGLSADDIEHLHLALEHRSIIGQAQGIVMGRLDVDADQAFAYLRRASQHTNRKLFDIAVEIAANRELIDLS